VIERFDWTDHALGHDGRGRNHGRADWLVRGERLDGRAFEVIYDHPVGEDSGRVRIVSVWEIEDRGLS
jgi:hypothetical protein